MGPGPNTSCWCASQRGDYWAQWFWFRVTALRSRASATADSCSAVGGRGGGSCCVSIGFRSKPRAQNCERQNRTWFITVIIYGRNLLKIIL